MATIINNTAVSDEANLRIENPYLYIADPDKGKPLAGAYLYFGEPDFDPVDEQYQKRVFLIQEDNSAIPIDQPIRTGAGGVPEYDGSPAIIAIDGDYSYKALSSQLEQKYYAPRVVSRSLLSIVNSSVIEDVIVLVGGQTSVTFPRADLSMATVDIRGENIDSAPLYRDNGYTIINGATGTLTLDQSYPAGTEIRARQGDNTEQDSGEVVIASTFYVFPDVSRASVSNLQIGDICSILGESSSDDGLGGDRYETVAGGSGPNDGVNFITITNGNQLKLASGRYNIKTFTESIGQATITSGTMFLDLNQGTVQDVTLTENVSSISFANVNSFAGLSSTVTLRTKQDGTGGRSVGFTGIKFAGGTAPTVTSTANAEDIFVFTTFDGSTWYGFFSGADFS